MDRYAARFKAFADRLNISYTNFIRTTDSKHKAAAQEFWRRCDAAGDIYKKFYRVKYCVGCELEKTDSEIEKGRCSLHPGKDLEIREEENYFFRLSKYQERLLRLYEERTNLVLPESRLREARLFVEKGLHDFSISRVKEKMPWGVEVPGDPEQIMYVWFDAFVNYISTIGWPEDMGTFKKWWPVVQMAGKDQVRMQVVMWQAMLFSAGLEPSKQIIIHGFITSGGQKMSKSVGNVIDPLVIADEYGVDALRYYLACRIPPFEDGDFTTDLFRDAYNADLANGIGNLAARILTMSETHLTEPAKHANKKISDFPEYAAAFHDYDLKKAGEYVWAMMKKLDERIAETEPFKLIKSDPEKGKALIGELAIALADSAYLLSPLMPETAEKILSAIAANKKPATLFPRK